MPDCPVPALIVLQTRAGPGFPARLLAPPDLSSSPPPGRAGPTCCRIRNKRQARKLPSRRLPSRPVVHPCSGPSLSGAGRLPAPLSPCLSFPLGGFPTVPVSCLQKPPADTQRAMSRRLYRKKQGHGSRLLLPAAWERGRARGDGWGAVGWEGFSHGSREPDGAPPPNAASPSRPAPLRNQLIAPYPGTSISTAKDTY